MPWQDAKPLPFRERAVGVSAVAFVSGVALHGGGGHGAKPKQEPGETGSSEDSSQAGACREAQRVPQAASVGAP